MLNVYLLRHGETAYNADGNRYCGRTDICLTSKGLKQAEAAFNQLKGISPDAVYSSPLERARHTASIAAGGKPVETDHRLIEVDFGSWEGKPGRNLLLKGLICGNPGLMTPRTPGREDPAKPEQRWLDAWMLSTTRCLKNILTELYL